MGQVSGTVYGGADIMLMDAVGGNSQSGGSVTGSGSYSYTINYTNQGFTGISWQPQAGGHMFSESELLGMTEERQLQLAQSIPAWNWDMAGCVEVVKIN